DDVGIRQVRGLDQHRDTTLGDQVAGALVGGVQAVGGVATLRPAVAEHDVRGGVGGAAAGEAPREQVPQAGGEDVRRRALGGGHHRDTDRAAPGGQVAQQRGELLLSLLVPDGGGEVGDLVDHDQDHGEVVVAGDLP